MSELEASLSFPTILLITINSIMGTGIFFLPALAAGVAGNASLISWVVMALMAVGISLAFAELASMFPTSGGIYEYCKQAFGTFPSFLIGWTTLIVGNVTIAMLVVGAVRYLNPALPDIYKIGFSILLVLIFNFMAFRGMQTSAVMLVTFALITLGTILSLTFGGFFVGDVARITPILSHARPEILLALFLVAETFFGWETATFLAEETKDARRVIPKALILGTLVIAVIVMLFVVSSLMAVGWEALGASPVPLALLAEVIFSPSAGPIFSILVYVSIIGSVAGWVVSSPRLIMALAKDKLFVESLALVHPRFKTPHKAILFQTIISCALIVVGAGSYELLLEMLVPMVLALYACVLVALLVLRYRQPLTDRYFKMPFAAVLVSLLTGALLFLIFSWVTAGSHADQLVGAILSVVFAGVPIYFLLKLTHDAGAVAVSAPFSGTAWTFFGNFYLPKRLREELLDSLSFAGKHVLEYGANVGTITQHIALRVTSDGKVTATELSSSNARALQKRMDKKGHSHVTVLHDEHHLNRLHPDVREVDAVVSVGYLSLIQDLGKVLRELADVLPEGGEVLFVDFLDYFKVLPNTGWTADLSRLQKTFSDCGFAVTVEKRRGLFWNYLIVRGIWTAHKVPYV